MVQKYSQINAAAQKICHKMTPQYLHLIQLLQIPEALIEQRVDREIEDNPMLDIEPDPGKNEDKQVDIVSHSTNSIKNVPQKYHDWEENSLVWTEPLADYLNGQLYKFDLSHNETILVEYIIGSLSEDGYWNMDDNVVINDIAIHYGIDVTTGDLNKMLMLVQTLEPAGVGARSLQECLIIQLQRLNDKLVSNYAIKIVTNYFEDFAKKKYDFIRKKLEIPADVFSKVIESIKNTNPVPVDNYNSHAIQIHHILPDFRITIDNDDEITVSLMYDYYSRLKINKMYINATKIQDNITEEFSKYLKEKKESAERFIQTMKLRQKTLLDTMKVIADIQHKFLISGDKKFLKPMRLQDIANVVNVDISTISRIVNNKSVETPFGVFLLRTLFSDAIKVENGMSISNIVVKNKIHDIIAKEDKHKPYSDEQLLNALKEQGFIVARRTVAKYREQLKIPTSRLRKM